MEKKIDLQAIKVLNVVVCYKNPEEVIEYAKKLEHLGPTEKLALSVAVNDDVTDVNKLQSELNKTSFLAFVTKPHANLGYLGGMTEAVKAFESEFGKAPDWIIMSNTDISYPDSDFFHRLLLTQYDEDIWCIGPSIFVPSKNAYDNPVLEDRRSRFAVDKTIAIFSLPGLRTIYQMLSNIKTKLCKKTESEKRFVYEVHGCYFIISRELYNAMIDRPFKAFMYSEEAYVAEIVYANGKKSVFDPNLKVNHDEHSVTGNLKYKTIARHIRDSMKYIKQEFYK